MKILESIFEDYTYMVEVFNLPNLKDTLGQLVKNTKEFTKQRITQSKNKIREFLEADNVITSEMIAIIKDEKEKLVEINAVLMNFTDEIDVFDSQYDQDISQLLSKLSSYVLSMQEPE